MRRIVDEPKSSTGDRIHIEVPSSSAIPQTSIFRSKSAITVTIFFSILLVWYYFAISTKNEVRIVTHSTQPSSVLENIIATFAIGVLSSKKYHDRLRISRNEWSKKWQERGLLYYYSDMEDETIPGLVKAWKCDDTYHGPNGLSCKTRFAFEHLQEAKPSAKWFLRIMDDTYVFVENMARLVKDLDPEKPYLIGAKNCQRHAVGGFSKFFKPDPKKAFFPDGGPGWLVSIGFLKLVNPNWHMWDEIVRGPMPVDDCAFGVFAAAHNVDIIHYKGFSQEPGDYPTCKECPYLCNSVFEKWTKPWIPVTFHQHWHGTAGTPNEMKALDQVLHSSFDFDGINPYQEFPQVCGCNQTRWYFDRCKPFTDP